MNEQRMTINEIKTTSIRGLKINLFRKLNIKDDRYNEINTYRNKCIKFNLKRMPQSRIRRQILFNNILFQEIVFNKIKL